MSNEELVSLIQGGKTELMEQLYMNNKKYIYKIVKRFSYITYSKYETEAITTKEDLLQESYFGLLQAVKNYNPSKEASFVTYAHFWIMQAIRKYISNCGNVLYVPMHMQQKIYRYNNITGKYLSKYNRLPTKEEYKIELEMNTEQLESVEKFMGIINVKSLDTHVETADESSITIGDTIPGNTDIENDVIDKITEEQCRNEVSELISKVLKGEVSNNVIMYRYFHGLTMKATGEIMGLSEEQVRQEEAKAIRRLRTNSTTKKIGIDYGFLFPRSIDDDLNMRNLLTAIG